MDEDTEVLDWGHEEDDYPSYDTRRSRENIGEPRYHADEDCDDTVSLGGDEDDLGVVYAYQSRSHQEKPKSSEISRHRDRDHHRESSHSSARQSSHFSPPHSSHLHAKLTHALPAKPVIAKPSVSVTQSQLLEASSMVNGRGRDRRNSIKKPVAEPLPPDWEVRHPRSGGTEVYYYNTKTHESTWVHPTLAPPKGSGERDDSANGISHQSTEGSRARSPSSPKNRPNPLPPQDLSFDDRHYRPMEPPISSSRVEHTLPQKPVFADRRSPERLSPAENSRHAHRTQAESERTRSRRGASPSSVRPPSPEDRRQEAERETRSRSSRMDSYVPSTEHAHSSTHDERDTVRPSTNRRSAPARDSPYGQETRSDYDSYVPMEEELPRPRRPRRSRSTSPRTTRTKDTEAEGVARRDPAARRRPREPETDAVANEVETKRRRLDSLREPGRPSPSSTSQHPSAEKNESLRGPPNTESRQRRQPLPPQNSLYKESMNSHVRESPPAQFLETSDLQPRQNGHGSDLAGRSRNSEPQPPSGPGGRRRAGDSRKQPRPEPMDVDSPAPSHPPRMQESRSASNAVPDRGDTKGDLPRGPKAMTSKPPPAPPTSLPPKPTTLSERYPGRSPPPHLVTPDERSSQRTDERPIIDSHSERHRDLPQEHRDPGIPQPRRRSPESRRPPTEPVPMPKLSGTNNVPIARSRYQPSTTPTPSGTDEPQQDHVSEGKLPLSNNLTRQPRHERGAIPDRAQTNLHELPDRPPPYQGPPALERRESNRSRHERAAEQPSDHRVPHNSRGESYPEGSGTRRNQLPPGAKVIYERPSPPLSPRREWDPLELSGERTKLDARRHNTGRLPESQIRADRTERVRIDRERAPRQEDRRRTRDNRGDEGRGRTDAGDYRLPLERRLSYEQESYSPIELPPPSPPSQAGNREDYDPSASGHDDRNYSRGSERTRTPSPSHNHVPSRGPRAYGDGSDGRRLPVRPRSPKSDVGERGYGKTEARSGMSSRGSSLLDRLAANNRTGERGTMEERFDDRVAATDVNMTSNGQESSGERRDNGKRRRKAKGSRR